MQQRPEAWGDGGLQVVPTVSPVVFLNVRREHIQAYLRDIVGPIPDHRNKASITIK